MRKKHFEVRQLYKKMGLAGYLKRKDDNKRELDEQRRGAQYDSIIS
jgi:hypothetical protein